MARAAEMLRGEKKMFAALSSSLSRLSMAREKVLLAFDGVDCAIVPDTKKSKNCVIKKGVTGNLLHYNLKRSKTINSLDYKLEGLLFPVAKSL